MKSLRVASVQFNHQPGDKNANLSTMRGYIEAAAGEGAEVVCFPECCVSGYWHLRHLSAVELAELAEPIPNGPTSKQLLNWSQEFNICIGAGLVEIDDAGNLYNSYVVTTPEGQTHCHRKLHCFISEHMQSGDAYTIFELPGGWRTAILICYDNNIPENARMCALAGAELILAPHQTGGCNSGSPFAMSPIDREVWDARESQPDKIHAEITGDKGRGWLMRWLPARAHDNGVFYVFSNGVGPDDDEVRTGNAMILDPYGRIIVETSKAGDDMVIADLDGSLRDRSTGVRWMRSRRPELYQAIATRRGDEQPTRAVRFDHS
ncbi:(R)-stereoselective amidase [Rubripirellula amarantea]|uniref:(R)-stereoselective amidase n=1 Tax=Rubripirellula amarantea TaxID=2527999 RepID=A0A5C5WLW1_9BACT|nr:nitrilase family protein [Rubripirellula amarantea]TWT50772.1 (R)-stereoselective amidase [Rubripirellula amarantea]